jgi:plastocyanin
MSTLSQPSISNRSSEPPTGPEPDPRAATWRRLATGGLLALPVLLTVMQVVQQVLIPPVIAFSLVFAGLGVALLAGKGRRILYATAVLGVVLVLANITYIIEDLGHPESFFGFTPSVIIPVVAFGTALAAFLATRARPPRGAGVVLGGGAVIVTLACIVSGVAWLGLEDDARQDGDVAITASNTAFPAQIAATAGDVGLYVRNDDVYRHTFVIEGTGAKVELPGSTARRLEATLAPGEYRFFCDVPGHESMQGTLVVR